MPTRPRPSRRRAGPALAAALIGAAVAFAAPAATKKPAKPELAEKQADLDELRGRIEGLRKELAASESNRAHAADRLRESEREISNLRRELHELGDQRGAAQIRLKELDRQTRELSATLAQQQGRLERLIYLQYLRGSPDSLQLLLNGDDPNQVARDLHYLSAIARSRADLLAEIRGTLDKKRALTDETQEQADELAAVEVAQKQQHEKLLRQQAERKTVLVQIADRVAAQRKEIGNLQQDEKRLSQLVDRLSKLLAARAKAKAKPAASERTMPRGEPSAATSVEAHNRHVPEASGVAFVKLRGSLRLPVKGAVIGRFGAAREGGSNWKGVFIRATGGSDVKAVAAGRVVFAEWMRGFGNLLILDHGEAYLSIYGNNESLLKQVGETVKGGDTIAHVGNSGGNPETGLYFELRHQGQPMDPLKWASLK